MTEEGSLMRRLAIGLAIASGVALQAPVAVAQTSGFALDRFEATPAGDRFFGVPGADPAGHGSLRAALVGDYAYRPLVLYRDDGDSKVGSIVSDQLFLHAGLSVALWDRLSVSVNAPFALITSGDSPSAGGVQVSSPSGAAMGDVRAGARLRLLGAPRGAAQVAVGAFLWLPTGDRDRFAGEGSVRGQPELSLSGEGKSFAYALHTGITLRPRRTIIDSEVGDDVTFGAAFGVLLVERKLQIGPEFYATTGLEKGFERENSNAEAVLGLKARFGDFVAGIAAGPGFTRGIGTPTLRGLLSLAYAPEPEPPPPPVFDRDHDGILDVNDACPDVRGIASDKASRNGCPDRDEDGIFDQDDACVDVAGVANEDPEKNGCPPDTDGDGIIDSLDACPEVAGVANDDLKKNGCPPDRDGDGIVDDQDACPDLKGVKSSDPEKNGCPPDTDGDGIRDDLDACPNEKGKPDPDPKKNGCPTLVRVTDKEILILQQVQFKTGSDVILKASDELLEQVSAVLREHPEIELIEVQGHTDNRGSATFNQGLSQRRAQSVLKWLVQKGSLEAGRFEAKGYGMDQPVAENTSDEGRQLNRRVQFKIVRVAKRAKPTEE